MQYSFSSVWAVEGSPGVQSASLNLYLRATGPTTINVPYCISFGNPSWTSLVNNWNFEVGHNAAWGWCGVELGG